MLHIEIVFIDPQLWFFMQNSLWSILKILDWSRGIMVFHCQQHFPNPRMARDAIVDWLSAGTEEHRVDKDAESARTKNFLWDKYHSKLPWMQLPVVKQKSDNRELKDLSGSEEFLNHSIIGYSARSMKPIFLWIAERGCKPNLATPKLSGEWKMFQKPTTTPSQWKSVAISFWSWVSSQPERSWMRSWRWWFVWWKNHVNTTWFPLSLTASAREIVVCRTWVCLSSNESYILEVLKVGKRTWVHITFVWVDWASLRDEAQSYGVDRFYMMS